MDWDLFEYTQSYYNYGNDPLPTQDMGIRFDFAPLWDW